MIDAALSLLFLLLGLGAVFFLGLGVFVVLVPEPRDFSRLERIALSFGIGSVLLTLWMLALSWLRVPFSLPLILGPLLFLATLALLAKIMFGSADQGAQVPEPFPSAPYGGWDWLLVGLLSALFLFVTLRAMLYPMWAWDAIAIWGSKARIFYESRAVDLGGIEAHNYYPNLVPLLMSYLYFCLGEVNDHLVQGLFPLWGALLLALLYSWFLRLGLSRPQALGSTAFLALNGVTLVVQMFVAYADLALAYFALGAGGLLYLWLRDLAPRGSLPLVACCCAGMAWCKYEGPPLAATLILAAALTLAWLRPPNVVRRLLRLAWPLAGLAAGFLPWKLFSVWHHLEGGSDHILNFYPSQLLQSFPYFLGGLFNPYYFGIFWPTLAVALILSGRRCWNSPRLFLVLFLGGNMVAIILAYALAPTSAEEFPQYVRSTLDRLLLHIAPVAALMVGEGVKELGGGPGE